MFLSLAVGLLCGALIGDKFSFAEHIDLATSCASANQICALSIHNEEPLVFANSTMEDLRTILILTSPALTYLPNELFQYAPKLEHIVVNKGGISRLRTSDFNGAQRLRSFALEYNHLLEITNDTFKEAPLLEDIHLPWNKIRRLEPAAFAGLIHLSYLSLRGNEIHNLPTDLFSVILNLEHIDLGSNLIEKIDATTFSSNLKLQTVILNDNKFSVFEPNVFSGFKSINTLNISESAVIELQLDTEVEHLYAANSSLQRCTFEGVAWMEAAHNQLTSLTVKSKNSVQQLELQYNLFETLNDFNAMINLERLDISHNNIKSIREEGTLLALPSLTYLNLAGNQVSEIKEFDFILMAELTYLDLSYNELNHLDPTYFLQTELKYLYLEGNHLHAVDFTPLLEYNMLVEIGLFGNDMPQAKFGETLTFLKAKNINVPDRTKPAVVEPEITTVPTTKHHHHNSASTAASSESTDVLPAKGKHHHHGHHANTEEEETTEVTHAVVQTGVTGIHPYWTAKDVISLMTLVVVIVILLMQFYRILLEEQCFHWCRRKVTRLNGANYPRNRNHLLDEEVSTF